MPVHELTRRLWRRRAPAIAVVALLVAAVAGSSAAAIDPTETGGGRSATPLMIFKSNGPLRRAADPTIQDLPDPCSGVRRNTKLGITTSIGTGQRYVCGTNRRDRISVPKLGNFVETWGASVWSFGGDDTINARNARPDEIDGGAGNDRGQFDSCDRVHNVEVANVSGDCPGVRPGVAKSPNDLEYRYNNARIECTTGLDGQRMIRLAEKPLMHAVDATPAVDWQFVAFTPTLYRWDGMNWQLAVRHRWLWDRSFDEQVTAFPNNGWRRLDTNQLWFLWFAPTQPGIYRVWLTIRWYAEEGMPAREVSAWAGPHYGPFEDPSHQWCVYPG
jgi:hypothetical protein